MGNERVPTVNGMDIPQSGRRFQELKVNTGKPEYGSYNGATSGLAGRFRPQNRPSHTSEETIRATPPMDIPAIMGHTISDDPEGSSSTDESSVEQYLRERQPSISFNKEITLDSGHRQSIDQPLQKPARNRPRGRSLLQAISDERSKEARAHSESDRTQYDPVTGRHLPKYSVTPPRDQPHIGEQRFPLLQTTVDALARESEPDLAHEFSLTSDSTISHASDLAATPHHEPQEYILSPSSISSLAKASSYEEPKEFKRTASQRWRDGNSASDFFTRASMRKGSAGSGETRRTPRHATTVSSIRSPGSAASSFLRGFSLSSGGEDNDDSTAFDAEGQTIGDNYVIGKQIGYGGFSVIKEVTQMQDSGAQRKLAAKIVRRNIEGKSESENEHVQAEFEHEVELWRFLNHPRILPLEAIYKTEDAVFCLIPLNTGGTLFDLVRNNRQGLPLELAQHYVYQLASALRYLHCDARVAHRDVKLENILIDKDKNNPDDPGNVRLCDFGMAEWISNDHASGPPSPRHHDSDRPPQKSIGPADTSTSAFAGGSLEYAAPEILRIAETATPGLGSGANSQRALVSPAVDIWAFGVCVYTLLVGSRPFSNSFQPRIVIAILAGDWDRERLRERSGEEVLGLVEGCLEMEVERRWNIGDVLGCEWFEGLNGGDGEESAGAGGQVGSVSGWRL